MNIAFLGGLVAAAGTHETAGESKWHTKNHEIFPEACRSLGSRIFTLGHTLVVASGETGTADFHAVEGAVQAVKLDPANNRGKILLVRPKIQEEDLFANWRSALTFLTERWGPDEPAFLKLSVIRHSDAAVILGGAEKAYYAGIAGAVSRRRVVPVGAFGGAGAELIYEFRNTFNRASDDWRAHMLEPDLLSQFENPWNDTVRSLALKALGAEGPRRLKIFIVHGHGLDHELLENFLNRHEDELNVQLTVMKEEFVSGATLPAKLERLAGEGQGAIVVATHDDLGGIAGGTNLRKRARQNVWLELGWFWGRLGLDRLLLLVRESDLELPSDIGGLEVHQYRERPDEKSEVIRSFIRTLR